MKMKVSCVVRDSEYVGEKYRALFDGQNVSEVCFPCFLSRHSNVYFYGKNNLYVTVNTLNPVIMDINR